MRRSRAPSNWPGPFFAARSWAGCTTNMFGFDLRQAQHTVAITAPTEASERVCCNCQLSIRYRSAPQKLRSTEAHRHQQLDLALELPAESHRRALRNILLRCELGPATVERMPAVD